MQLLKRQDLISLISQRLTPSSDKVSITITLEEMDPFVLCIGTKKSLATLQKIYQDVVSFKMDALFRNAPSTAAEGGGKGGAIPHGAESLRMAPKSPNNVTSTFFNNSFAPKRPQVRTCGRHLTSLRPLRDGSQCIPPTWGYTAYTLNCFGSAVLDTGISRDVVNTQSCLRYPS